MTAPQISIVVPARNEASRLEATFDALVPLVDRSGGTELVFALDSGSEDETVAIGERIASTSPGVRVEVVDSRGKGYAVAVGVRAASGGVVLLADADLSVDPSQFDALIGPASQGALAIASRSVDGSRRLGEPPRRYVYGRVFNLAVRTLVLPGVRDSQCGFKAFRRDLLGPVFDAMETQGWCFDVELIARARQRRIPVVEVPVTWRYGHGSKVNPRRDALQIARELLHLRRRFGRVPQAGPGRPVP